MCNEGEPSFEPVDEDSEPVEVLRLFPYILKSPFCGGELPGTGEDGLSMTLPLGVRESSAVGVPLPLFVADVFLEF